MAVTQFSSSDTLHLDRRPRYLLLLSALCLAGAALLSTRVFPDLGPAPEMLLHEDAARRWTARVTLLEILAVRLLMAAVGAALAGIWIFWDHWARTPWVRRIAHHQPSFTAAGPLFGRSLAIMLGIEAGVLVWLALGGRYPDTFMPPWVGMEDGLVEYATAFLFLACAPMSALMAMRTGERRRRVIHWMLAALFVLCFFEEISWGQRLFGLATPDALDGLNAQDEMNLHNSFGYSADHAFMVAVFAYGAVLPVATRVSPLIHRMADLLGLPIASLGLAVGFAIASWMHDWTVYSVFAPAPVNVAEFREFIASVGFVLLMVETLRQQRQHGVPRAGAASAAG